MEKRTKVLFLITKSNYGGAQRYVFDLAVSLAKSHDVVVAAGGPGILLEKLHGAGIRSILIPHLGRDIGLVNDIAASKEIWRVIQHEKPDVLHLNSSKIGGLGGFLGRLAGVRKIIFTLHGAPFEENRGAFSRAIIKAALWCTILLSHRTIAVSNALRAAFTSLPGMESRIIVIHNGVGANEYISRDEARAFLVRSGAHFDTFPVVGTIAELHAIKGLRYLIDAIARLKENGVTVRCMIIGDGEERAWLEKHTRERGLQDRVQFLGFIPDAGRYVTAFDIFTMTSIYEGLNSALLEAGTAGIPVVATNVGGIPEIITADSGILVPARDPVAIASALQNLLENSTERVHLGGNLAQRVRTAFSLNAMIEKTRALYAD